MSQDIDDPFAYVMSPTKRKKKRKASKGNQNYDPNPPKCADCVNWSGRVRKGFMITPYCGIGGFAAAPGGVCDLWAGKDGTVLEQP